MKLAARVGLVLRAGDLEERLGTLLLTLRLLVGSRALVGLAQPGLRVLDSAAQLALIEILGRHGLADEHRGAVREHLEPALGLGPALHVAAGHVQAELRRAQARQYRDVVREDPDLADRRAG